MIRNILIGLFMILLFIYSPVPAVGLSDISCGGQVATYIEKEQDGNYGFLNELKLKFDTGTFNYNGHLESSIVFNDPEFKNLNDFSLESQFNLEQAYLDFWFPEGEIKIGKQRIAWGSGYFFNPTDLINPIKEGQRVEMNPRESSNSIYGSYYLGNSTLEGVMVTSFQPVGPENDTEATSAAREYSPFLTGKVKIPESFSEEMEYALKYATVVNNYDLSLLYYQGREDYPVMTGIQTGNVIFNYPEKDVFGIDLAGTIGEVGVWGEAAHSSPEIGDSYLQYIIGADYTFKNGFHLLGEYYHDDSLSNFIPDQDVKLKDFIGLAGDFNLTDLIKVSGSMFIPFESNFYLVNGEVIYSIAQDVELKSGFNQALNEEGTIFEGDNSIFPVKDNIYLQVIYYF